VLGRSATIENFHFAVTHSGVTLCLRVAELIGAEVRGELGAVALTARTAAPCLVSAQVHDQACSDDTMSSWQKRSSYERPAA
jgi:hypothetical protein